MPVRSHFLNPGSGIYIPYNLPYRGIKVIRNRCRPGDLLASALLGTSRCMHVCFMAIITALKCQYQRGCQHQRAESTAIVLPHGTVSKSGSTPWGVDRFGC